MKTKHINRNKKQLKQNSKAQKAEYKIKHQSNAKERETLQ